MIGQRGADGAYDMWSPGRVDAGVCLLQLLFVQVLSLWGELPAEIFSFLNLPFTRSKRISPMSPSLVEQKN